jgi:hypothetical protein
VLSYERGEHDSIRGKPFRGLELGPGVGAYLDEFRTELHKLLWGELRSILLRWYHKLVRQDADQEDDEVDERARRMCTLHAHLLLSLRNCRPEELTQPLVQTLVCGMIFLSTRHQWNHRQLADEFGSQEGAASYDDWRVPETEVFECLHVVRRKLVQWVRYDGASQLMIDELMDAVVRVSESEGSLMPRADEARMRWAPLNGQVNRGRFQQNGSRTGGGSGAAAEGEAAAGPWGRARAGGPGHHLAGFGGGAGRGLLVVRSNAVHKVVMCVVAQMIWPLIWLDEQWRLPGTACEKYPPGRLSKPPN